MLVVWSVCFHRDYHNIITEKSPRGRCRGHFRQASVSLGKFSIKARGGHLPYLCPMPPWHSPQGKDGKEDRRAGGRREGSQSCTEEVSMVALKPLSPNNPSSTGTEVLMINDPSQKLTCKCV